MSERSLSSAKHEPVVAAIRSAADVVLSIDANGPDVVVVVVAIVDVVAVVNFVVVGGGGGGVFIFIVMVVVVGIRDGPMSVHDQRVSSLSSSRQVVVVVVVNSQQVSFIAQQPSGHAVLGRENKTRRLSNERATTRS